MTDPIADMLTRIRNGLMAGKAEVRTSFSKMKFALSKIMEAEGYVAHVEVTPASNPAFQDIVLTLKYHDKQPAIREVTRVSKPGRRVYAKADALPHVRSGIGIAILSTPNGLMTNKEARKRHLGGEVLCELF